MNWKELNIELGVLKEKQKIIFSFVAVKELEILKIKPGCASCTKVKKMQGRVLPIIFTAEKIPVHLKQQGYQKIKKQVIVTYKDGSKEVLSFTATVIL